MGISRPAAKKPTEKNPFMKPEVKLISDELTNASRQNFNEAMDKKYPSKSRPRGRGPNAIGSTRG